LCEEGDWLGERELDLPSGHQLREECLEFVGKSEQDTECEDNCLAGEVGVVDKNAVDRSLGSDANIKISEKNQAKRLKY
jgi:hypothetical protein